MTAKLSEIRKKLDRARPFDILVVFGEGPVKPVLTPHEISEDKIIRWKQYKADPIQFREPNFYVIDDPQILQRVSRLNDPRAVRKLRSKWQKNSRFSLKRWGRQNALAAGLALYAGLTRKVLLSGGKTKPKWLEQDLDEIKSWPTEARLMKDTITRNFGGIYFEKYGKDIKDALVLEEKATNSLENFAYSINKMPEMVLKNKRIGLLTANHHVKRVSVLAKLFSLKLNNGDILSAQELLKKSKLYSSHEKDILQILNFLNECGDLKDLNPLEERWIRGLKDPKYLTYWMGYVAEVKHPIVLESVFAILRHPDWNKAAAEAFSTLKIEDYVKQDIRQIQKNKPKKYKILIEKLRLLKTPEYRKLPPPIVA